MAKAVVKVEAPKFVDKRGNEKFEFPKYIHISRDHSILVQNADEEAEVREEYKEALQEKKEEVEAKEKIPAKKW